MLFWNIPLTVISRRAFVLCITPVLVFFLGGLLNVAECAILGASVMAISSILGFLASLVRGRRVISRMLFIFDMFFTSLGESLCWNSLLVLGSSQFQRSIQARNFGEGRVRYAEYKLFRFLVVCHVMRFLPSTLTMFFNIDTMYDEECFEHKTCYFASVFSRIAASVTPAVLLFLNRSKYLIPRTAGLLYFCSLVRCAGNGMRRAILHGHSEYLHWVEGARHYGHTENDVQQTEVFLGVIPLLIPLSFAILIYPAETTWLSDYLAMNGTVNQDFVVTQERTHSVTAVPFVVLSVISIFLFVPLLRTSRKMVLPLRQISLVLVLALLAHGFSVYLGYSVVQSLSEREIPDDSIRLYIINDLDCYSYIQIMEMEDNRTIIPIETEVADFLMLDSNNRLEIELHLKPCEMRPFDLEAELKEKTFGARVMIGTCPNTFARMTTAAVGTTPWIRFRFGEFLANERDSSCETDFLQNPGLRVIHNFRWPSSSHVSTVAPKEIILIRFFQHVASDFEQILWGSRNHTDRFHSLKPGQFMLDFEGLLEETMVGLYHGGSYDMMIRRLDGDDEKYRVQLHTLVKPNSLSIMWSFLQRIFFAACIALYFPMVCEFAMTEFPDALHAMAVALVHAAVGVNCFVYFVFLSVSNPAHDRLDDWYAVILIIINAVAVLLFIFASKHYMYYAERKVAELYAKI
ncbi:unnamed protein product [Notodromas monacha]|uniref:Uncharacterized protein n=1 Tax=Notodromas monacha TaxID=399045 RepID=A0A7R9BM00_9CRUS|nr:unnamed protein product [Notodromas monacha]CAG0917081.1 unnamed protein product [Notodromas monacha]